MYPAIEPSRQGSEKIEIGNVQNFAPMGAPPENISSRKIYDNRREEIIVVEGKL